MGKTLVALAVVVVLVAVAACSSSKKSGGLASGTYTIANGATSPNDCKLNDLSQLNGSTIPVTVAGNTVSLPQLALDLTLAGNVLSAPQQVTDINWTTTAGERAAGVNTLVKTTFNCVQRNTTDISGTVTATNAFHLDRDVRYLVTTGAAAACIAANNSAFLYTLSVFPCESKLSFDASM